MGIRINMKFTTRYGLYISPSFTSKFGKIDVTPAATVPGFKTLERPMYDHEIKVQLGAEECTLEDVAAFLENPPEGTKGGYANIFYVSGFVVRVRWLGGEWDVDGWSLDDGSWGAGDHVAMGSTKETSFADLIKPFKFGYVNPLIEPNFPLMPVRSSEYKVFTFGRRISSEVAVAEMEKEGYLAANLAELFSWKDASKGSPILALGQSAQVDGDREVPGLWHDDGTWGLGLGSWDDGWDSDGRFLAVRNQSSGLGTSAQKERSEPLDLFLSELKTLIAKHENN